LVPNDNSDLASVDIANIEVTVLPSDSDVLAISEPAIGDAEAA